MNPDGSFDTNADEPLRRAQLLHQSPWRGVLHITGGGARLLEELLTTPGASATVLEATVPYAESALAELLGRRPDQACAAPTARAMAMAAFQRARRLAPLADPATLFGLGATASLATGRAKRGAHRAHVAIQTVAATREATVHFSGGGRPETRLAGPRARDEQEALLLDGLWRELAVALDLPQWVAEGTTPNAPSRTGAGAGARSGARSTASTTHAPEAWRELILGHRTTLATQPHDGRLLLPGAFNPLHHGHERMLALAEARTGRAGAYELSIANVDKPLLDYAEIAHRLAQFEQPVWLTRLPTFVEKARAFPETVFAVGADTIERIAAPRYYGGVSGRDAALAELRDLGVSFCVFGRSLEGRFQVLDDLPLPPLLRALCIGVSAAEFNDPISSSALRGG
ncbi:MAG: hypothetical protein ACKOBM_13725 [Gammaproteobacteria bacterium]